MRTTASAFALALLCAPALAQDPSDAPADALEALAAVGGAADAPTAACASRDLAKRWRPLVGSGPQTVFKGDELFARGYRNLGEALASVPGVFVSYDLVHYHASPLGSVEPPRAGNRGIVVLVDGVRTEYRASGESWLGQELVPLSAVERVEVYLGPQTARLGNGGQRGLINVVTKGGPVRCASEGLAFAGDARVSTTGVSENAMGVDASAQLSWGRLWGSVGAAITGADRSHLHVEYGSAVRRSDEPWWTAQDAAAPALSDAQKVTRDDYALPASGLLRAGYAGERFDVGVFALGQLQHRTMSFHPSTELARGVSQKLGTHAGVNARGEVASFLAVSAQATAHLGSTLPGEELVKFPSDGVAFVHASRTVASDAQATAMLSLFERVTLSLGGTASAEHHVVHGWNDVDVDTGDVIERIEPKLAEIYRLGGFTAGHLDFDWLKFNSALSLQWHSVLERMVGGFDFEVVATDGRTFSTSVGLRTGQRPPYLEPVLFAWGRLSSSRSRSDLTSGVNWTYADVPGFAVADFAISLFALEWLKADALLFYGGITDTGREDPGADLIYSGRYGQVYGTHLAASGGLAPSRDVTLEYRAALSLQHTAFGGRGFSGHLDNEGVPFASSLLRVGAASKALMRRAFVEYRFVSERAPSSDDFGQVNVYIDNYGPYSLAAAHLVDVAVSSAPIALSDLGSVTLLAKATNILGFPFPHAGGRIAPWLPYSEVGTFGRAIPGQGTTLRLDARLTF